MQRVTILQTTKYTNDFLFNRRHSTSAMEKILRRRLCILTVFEKTIVDLIIFKQIMAFRVCLTVRVVYGLFQNSIEILTVMQETLQSDV